MTKKGTRRIIKRKQGKNNVKQSVRDRLKQQRTNQSLQSTKSNVEDSQMNISSLANPNSLRGVLMGGMLTPSMGYHANQYGSVSPNEQMIRNLQQMNQSLLNDKRNEQIQIETMKKEAEQAKKDAERLKKEKKDVKLARDKAEHERDMASDELKYNEKEEMETERLTAQQRRLEKDNAKINIEGNIKAQKDYNAKLSAEMHQKQLALIQQQGAIASNTLYNESVREQNKLTLLNAQIEANKQILNSKEFLNPDENYIKIYKNRLLAEEYIRQETELMKLDQEQKRQAEIIKAQLTDDDMKAITEQYQARWEEANKKKRQHEKDAREYQDKIDIIEYKRKKTQDAKKEEIDEHERYIIAKKQNEGLQSQVKKIGKMEQKQINDTAKMKNQRVRTEKLVKSKEELIQQRHENAVLQATYDMTPDTIDEEQRKLINNIEQEKASNDALTARIGLKKEERVAAYNRIKEQSAVDALNSETVQNILHANEETVKQTQMNEESTKQLKMLKSSKEHLERAAIEHNITTHGIAKGLSAIEQQNYVNELAYNGTKDMVEKEKLYAYLSNESKINHGVIAAYATANRPELNGILVSWPNQDLSLLKTIVREYDAYKVAFYKRNPNQQPSITYEHQQPPIVEEYSDDEL